ncbi:hypothetical protein [Xanthobacter autotrophicus]|uniref:hypothetical protein n=1 Tax=Xanthobacter autotrophicus TaxID=280 RepID=UPI0024A7915A|nr:hypothetical protein [Xanthobacter autotrophicus]MDI4658877.1 hypothetical protein [Xanthobacter autotrophicus]
MTDEPDGQKPTTPYHPEEMKATWDVRVGKSISLQGTAHWTPAGVVTTGIAASAVLLSIAALVRATRKP